MKINKISILFAAIFLSVVSSSVLQAQTAFHNADLAKFESRLVASGDSQETIVCNFKQEKYMDVFSNTIVSKGTFTLKGDNKIRFDYSEPEKSTIIVNNDKIKIVSAGRTNVMSLKGNTMMSQMTSIISGMKGGTARFDDKYTIEILENSSQYKMIVTPKSASAKKYLNSIEVCFSKKDMTVDTLQLNENATDYTRYIFSDKKLNTTVSDSVFAIK